MNRRGMTLIELLVGLFLAALVSYIAFDLIRDEQGNYTKTRTKVRLQADAREAIRIMEEDFANLGFREGLRTKNAANKVSPIFASMNSCPDIREDQRLFVWDDGGTSSDSIEGRFYRVHPDSGVDCKTSPFRIRYVIKGTDLVRRFWKAGDSVNHQDAVVLHDVETMQARAAIDTLLTTLAPAQKALNEPLSDAKMTLGTGASLIIGTPILYGAGDTLLPVSGWKSTPASLETTTGINLMRGASYRLSCMIKVNDTFHAAFNDAGKTGSLRFIASISTTSLNDTTDVRLPSIINGPTWISWTFKVPVTNPGPLNLTFTGNLAKDTSTAVLSIGSIHLQRLSGFPVPDTIAQPAQFYWTDAKQVSPIKDSAYRAQTKALRVWLVTKSKRGNNEANSTTYDSIGNWNQFGKTPSDKKTYAIFERTMQVVNHGY